MFAHFPSGSSSSSIPFLRNSEFTPEKIRRSRGPSIQDSDAEDTGEDHGPTTSLPSPQAHLKIIEREASNTPENAEVKAVADDPLAEFYAQARAELDENVGLHLLVYLT